MQLWDNGGLMDGWMDECVYRAVSLFRSLCGQPLRVLQIYKGVSLWQSQAGPSLIARFIFIYRRFCPKSCIRRQATRNRRTNIPSAKESVRHKCGCSDSLMNAQEFLCSLSSEWIC